MVHDAINLNPRMQPARLVHHPERELLEPAS
jgi:hypothetical protein